MMKTPQYFIRRRTPPLPSGEQDKILNILLYNDIIFRNWDFIITYSMVVENTVGWPNYNWMPDGHISTLQVPVNKIATA